MEKRRRKGTQVHPGPESSQSVFKIFQGNLWSESPPLDMLRLETELQDRGFSLVAGLDEVGRGPLAGPVVAAAVILPAGRRYEGLTDSKLLNAGQREKWFEQIRETAEAFFISSVSEREIDEINILQASKKAMELAVRGLSISPDFLLIDGIVPLASRIPQRCIKKGDRKSLSIAAASVLAKVTRDRLMEDFHQQYPQYNFKKNKGYGTLEHRQALNRFGFCPIHRKSFRGVKEQQASGKKTEPSTLFK